MQLVQVRGGGARDQAVGTAHRGLQEVGPFAPELLKMAEKRRTDGRRRIIEEREQRLFLRIREPGSFHDEKRIDCHG